MTHATHITHVNTHVQGAIFRVQQGDANWKHIDTNRLRRMVEDGKSATDDTWGCAAGPAAAGSAGSTPAVRPARRIGDHGDLRREGAWGHSLRRYPALDWK